MEILYKYVTHQRALTCIPEVGDGTLRATQPTALNDPFECAITPVYVFPSEEEENQELATILTGINENRPKSAEDVSKARKEHGSLFTRQLFSEQLSTKYGIVSFSKDPFHPLMWSHYSGDGSGFVIGYEVTELGKLTSLEEGLRSVSYHSEPPRIAGPKVPVSPDANRWVLLSIKSDHWAYEDEWRLIAELSKTVGTGNTDQLNQPINLVQIPNNAVVSVYYTERTPPDSVELIRQRLADRNNRYRALEPRKLVMSHASYGYEEAPNNQ